MKRIDFYYDFSCPYAYLASTQIEALAARRGAELVWRPMLLGGVFRAIGSPDVPVMIPPKARLNHLDMHRWADHLGVPLVAPPGHPNRTVLALRATLAAEPEIARASHALFRAYWARGRDVSRPEIVREALDEAGLDGAALLARAEAPAIKDALRARTDEAVARGVFGAPTFVVTKNGVTKNGVTKNGVTTDGGAELYWGQDRLPFVEEALGGPAPYLALEPAAPAVVPEVSFFFDVSSPFAYLAATQIDAFAARVGVRARWRPFLLGGLFKAIGTVDVPLFAMPAAKRQFAAADIQRWASHHGVPLRFPSRFPMNTLKALRMILELSDAEKPALALALFRALWVDDRDLYDDAELASIAASIGLDGAALVAGARADNVKEQLKLATIEAAQLGLCGAPSFLVGDLLFWGQDRLPFVEKALRGWRPRGE